MGNPFGKFVRYDDLNGYQKHVVDLAWKGANASERHKLCFKSNFPVGVGISALNPNTGLSGFFWGSNLENENFPSTICAERSAILHAAKEGYTQIVSAALICKKFPGGSPCGLCRQVLVQFGQSGDLLNIDDQFSNVRISKIPDLLPAARRKPVLCEELKESERSFIKRLDSLKGRSYVPYSKKPRAALVIASNEEGAQAMFAGVSDDNASYGGSALAEAVAMRTARTAGHSKEITLITSVEDNTAPNPIDGECLQILREFGPEANVLLFAPNNSVVRTSLQELLPDSFGPEGLD